MTISRFFYASDHKSLSFLDDFYELRSLEQGVECSSIKPSSSSRQNLHFERSLSKIRLIHISDFIFSSSARLKIFRYVYDTIIIKIEPRNGIIRFWLYWFLFQRKSIHRLIKLYYTISLRIIYMISEDDSSLWITAFF